MQYYKAKLRLSGSTSNEVRGIYSAPEILILQYIHGVDAVVEVQYLKTEQTNLRNFKDMLKGKYDQALVKRDQSIDKIFGALGQLPNELPGHLLEKFDIVDEADVLAIAKSATRKDKSHVVTQQEQDRKQRLVPQEEVSMEDIME